MKIANLPFAGIDVSAMLSRAPIDGDRLSRRLKAWWHGNEFADFQANIDEDAEDFSEDIVDPNDLETWGRVTMKTIESVWGAGFMEPGGVKVSRRVLGWLAINSRHTVLDLTAGMGGVARSIADTNSLWMDAYEPVAELAERGQHRSVVAGMAKRVPIKYMDFSDPDLRENRYDMIYSRERLFTVAEKPKLIQACATALKDRGQILITDYMLGAKRTQADVMENWGSFERETPHLWSLGEYNRSMEAAGLTIINSQDMSDDVVSHAVSAWNSALLLVTEGRYSKRQTKPLILECQIWLDRLAAIERGDIYVGRVHAQYRKR
ncbi:MAG: methyltransferase domain-containing protein [Alphaproteobacteria bacterium]